MRNPVWLLDFDGVVNALSRRPPKTVGYREWRSARVEMPSETRRSGKPVVYPLLWSPTVVSVITRAVDAGVDVRWLTTWREHTRMLPEIIPGLPELPWIDESCLPPAVAATLDPAVGDLSVQWKIECAKATVGEDVPVLWTDDSILVGVFARRWARTRKRGLTTAFTPRPNLGLIPRDLSVVADWVARHTGHRLLEWDQPTSISA